MELADSQVSNVSNDAIVSFQIDWMRLEAEKKQIIGRQGARVKAAKADGINTDAAVDAVKKKRRFSAEENAAYMRDLIRALALQHMPLTQEDLFNGWQPGVSPGTEVEMTLMEAEDQGFKAGRHGVDLADCPFSPGTQHHAVWHKEYQKGVASKASAGTEPVAATRERPARGRQARIPGTEGRQRPPPRTRPVAVPEEAQATAD